MKNFTGKEQKNLGIVVSVRDEEVWTMECFRKMKKK